MHKDFQQQKINYKADLKAAKDSNRHFFIKVQVANSYTTKCSIAILIWQCKSKLQ